MAQVTVRADDGRQSSLGEPLVEQIPVYTDVIVPGSGGCLGAVAVVLIPGGEEVTAALPCQAIG